MISYINSVEQLEIQVPICADGVSTSYGNGCDPRDSVNLPAFVPDVIQGILKGCETAAPVKS